MTRLTTSLSFVLALASSYAGVLDPCDPGTAAARSVMEGKQEAYCTPSGPIDSTNCAYETIEALNINLFPAVHDLVSHPFFKYYKVDLFRQCPFWNDNGGLCMNRACAVQEADESEIPTQWRARALSQVQMPAEESISGCYFRHDDFCSIQDDASPGGQYIDLTLNPERFTGYAGDGAHDIWRAIYQENCFGLSEASLEAAKKGLGRTQAPPAFGLDPGMGMDMRQAGLAPAEMCEEKKMYYRVISGLHASISIHICAEYLNRETGQWEPNLDCFIWRIAKFPERLSNVYFNAVLLLRAVARAAPYFRAYDIGTTPPSLPRRAEDEVTRKSFDRVLALAERADIASSFAEDNYFNSHDAPIIMDEFKSHFRNVSRIMDCVGCDKCRLWGKLQVSGLGTALKILFALDEKDLDPKANPDLLLRTEVVALFNTLHRVAESLDAVKRFRRMYADRVRAEKEARWCAIKEEMERERLRAIPQIYTEPHWLYTTTAALGATLTALLESLHRRCKGCLEVVTRWVSAQGAGKVEL